MILVYLYPEMADFEVSFLLHRLKNQGHREICGIAKDLNPLTAQSGLTYLPDRTIDEVKDTSDVEALLIPGGPLKEDQNEICPLLKRLAAEGKLIGAICFAPQFLGRAGLLSSYTFTTSCSKEQVEEAGITDPFCWDHYVKGRVHRDRNLITAEGTAFVDFAKAVCDALHVFSSKEEEAAMIDIVKAS